MFRPIVLVSLLASSAFSDAEPLTFEAALNHAVRASPDVVIEEASVDSARAAAQAAGRLPDPRLAVGVENLPATGDGQWSLAQDFMTMRKIGLMQEVPNGKRRRAEREIATAT